MSPGTLSLGMMDRLRRLHALGSAIRSARAGALRTAAALGDGLAALVPAGPAVPLRAAWRPGVSVVIPERGTPDLLERALAHVGPALARVAEPAEILVVVNGAEAAGYARLRAAFPSVRWQFHALPLGFAGAVARGLAAARHGAVYLHNSDMAVEPDALAALLPWRAPHVFAIASQIFFDDANRRREETGWAGLRLADGLTELFDIPPDAGGPVRGGLYAGGGSSLFDAALLRRFARTTGDYHPFYWEDADWGAQAWQSGLEVLFHPGSVAWHRHRATIGRLYPPAEVDRIFARNGLLFDLRTRADAAPVLRAAGTGAWESLKELAGPKRLGGIARARAGRRRKPFAAVDLAHTPAKAYARPDGADSRPTVLIVTPYRILPPRHGGARRIRGLCEALKERWRFVLLSDEADAHGPEAWRDLGPFDAVHLAGGRPDGGTGRTARIASHSHPALQTELDRLVAVHRPALVQMEYVELAGLTPPAGVPCILTAHDVLFPPGGPETPADRWERQLLARFAAIVACSAEDAALLAPLPAALVPNGAAVGGPWRPSAGNRTLLFAGPFRYRPNLEGLRGFLDTVFPALRRRFPDLGLTVLGGDGARAVQAAEPLLRQPGVTVVEAVDDVRPWLDACALTINPLTGTRGSSLKLIESLAAGRVCVSTRDGARGFLDTGLPGLVTAGDIAGLLEPIARLIDDEPARLALEAPRDEPLRPFSWEAAARAQERLYRDLLGMG